MGCGTQPPESLTSLDLVSAMSFGVRMNNGFKPHPAINRRNSEGLGTHTTLSLSLQVIVHRAL